MNEQRLKKKLNIMIVTVILLVCGLAVTSYALANAIVQLRNNRFAMSMGAQLVINDGAPVIDVTDVVYEPGGAYKSEFPIANLGAFDVWYRVYFSAVDGVLKDYITVTVKEADGTLLCQGTMNELDAHKVAVGSLAAGETKMLYIEFCFSSQIGNEGQGQTVSFNITADATQKQNNPHKDFGD